MALRDLNEFLKNEKDKLFKARDYINNYYHQIATSLESLRDNLLPYSFSQRLTWKDSIDRKSTQITVPDIIPRNVYGDPEFNSNTLIAVINNLFAIQNAYLFNPSVIEKPDVKLIKKTHAFLITFLEEQFSHANIEALKKQQRDLAYTLKQNVEERIHNTINPFFQRLEMILDDEYRIALTEHIRLLVLSFANYKKSPQMYDDLIADKCRELGLKNNPELNLVIIADLEKPEALIETEIRAKYEFQDKKKALSKSYRLKEIALRYSSQAENLASLMLFLKEASNSIHHIPLMRRIILFFKSLFTGREPEISHYNITFSYVTSRGKIERKKASLNDLLSGITYYLEYLGKFKEDLDLSTYTKNLNPQLVTEIDKFVDTSFTSFNDIYEKSSGFREWLGRENNRPLLRRIPEKLQEDFNNLLLHINRTCIVNNYNLQEFDL